MLHVLNFLSILYIILLFKKKHPISLSMFWIVIFYFIYVLVPLFRNNITILQWVPDDLINQLSFYAIIGLLAFVATNWFSLLRWEKLDKMNIAKKTVVSHNNTKKILNLMILFSIAFVIISVGFNGIINIFIHGSRSVWLNYNDHTIFATLAELSFFYVTILASVNLLSAQSKLETRTATVKFILILLFMSILVFARRHIIYPVFAVVFYKLSQVSNKSKIIKAALIIFPIFFLSMFMMGYMRVFGASNISISSIVEYLKYGNFFDIFVNNTDFGISYLFYAKQVDAGEIFIGPLSYFKAFFALIPRSVWPNKPIYSSVQILSILEPEKVSQGYSAATGYLGEAYAALGIFGIVIVSSIWGLVCGVLDKKFNFITKSRKTNIVSDNKPTKFLLFEYIYIYFAGQFITESHRGDFGAASIHFILEVLLVAFILRIISKVKLKW